MQDRFLTANQLSWNEPTGKLNIDHRFGDLMHKLCDNGGSPSVPGVSDHWACDQMANAFEAAVRQYGNID